MLLLGLDIGTTGAKAAVFSPDGRLMGYGFREYGIVYTPEGFAEQDAEEIFLIAKEVLKEAAAGIGSEIGAISLSVQGDAVVAIDRHRKAISPVQLGMDYRGMEETALCGELIGDKRCFELTGMRPHPMNSIVKIFWARRHTPALYEAAFKYVTYSDFILGKLGSDEIVIDYTQASRTMAFDLRKKRWSAEILTALGISEDKLAKPVPSCSVVGTIDPVLAAELGISPKASLITGGHDQTCAALGAGIIRENMALDSHGTAEVVSTVFHDIRTNDSMYGSYYPCYCSLLKDLYFSFSLNHTGGILLKWFVEEFCREDCTSAKKYDRNTYEYLFSRLKDAPSPLMVVPYFNGSGTPTCDLSQKGAILGLTMNSDRFDVAKAILESLSFEIRLNMDSLRAAGIDVKELRSVGGGARSPAGLQNKADILGIPVSSLKIREAACLGAALAAGLACGVYASAEEATSIVEIKDVYLPRASFQEEYDQRFEIYRRLYPTLKDISAKL